MLNLLDRWLDSITMYKLMLYGLLLMGFIAIMSGFLGFLPAKGYQYLISLTALFSFCFITNFIIAKLFRIPTNSESSYITGLILFFILAPFERIDDLLLYMVASGIGMASKYLIAFHRKHIFNPAAFAAFVLGLFGSPLVTWWIGSSFMLPFVGIFGFLILRKVRRFRMFFVFLSTAVAMITVLGVSHGYSLPDMLSEVFVSWPILFFGTVMFTEPLTTPPTNTLRLFYGVIVGILFGVQFHIGPLFSSPELALLLGNIFSYMVSSKEKLLVHLQEKRQIARDMYAFIFTPKGKFSYVPGQYMEWTVPHKGADSRGNRRYFTLASSPTEDTLQLGLKIVPNGSSFKKKLVTMDEKAIVLTGQLAGDFTLPKDIRRKLVFLAGGIGITPFRSMIKYLVDKNEKRDIIMLYSNKTSDEIVYKDIFDQADKTLGIKTIYTITDTQQVPTDWKGEQGRIDAAMIQKYVPDYKDRFYYISGPHVMVVAYQDILKGLGIASSQVIVDYFPGFV